MFKKYGKNLVVSNKFIPLQCQIKTSITIKTFKNYDKRRT